MGGRGSYFGKKNNKKETNIQSGPITLINPEKISKILQANSKQKQESINHFVEYINKNATNNETRELYNNLPKLIKENIIDKNIKFDVIYTNKKNANYSVSSRRSLKYGKMTEITLVIPRLKESTYSEHMNITAHELGHLIDLSNGDGRGGLSTANNKELNQIISRPFKGHSKEVQKKFDDIRDEPVKISNQIKKRAESKRNEIIERYVKKQVSLNNISYSVQEKMKKEIIKEKMKIKDEWKEQIDKNKLIHSENAFQDIYDALSGGIYYNNRITTAGHVRSYYREKSKRSAEIFANYLQLSIESKELLGVLKKDQPDLVKVLEKIRKELSEK